MGAGYFTAGGEDEAKHRAYFGTGTMTNVSVWCIAKCKSLNRTALEKKESELLT